MFPLILLGALGLLFLGGALFQVGRGADYKARAQTGADAAAVAAARALGGELSAGLAGLFDVLAAPALPPPPPAPVGPAIAPAAEPVPPPVLDDVLDAIDVALVRSEAARWADRNDTDLVSVRLDLDTMSVAVETRTKGTIGGLAGDRRGHAGARARLRIAGVCLPAGAAAGRGGAIPVCADGQQPGLGNASLAVRLVE